MNPKYIWTCHVCDASNSPGTVNCAKCNFPFEASAKEIELAKTQGSSNIVIENKEKKRKSIAEWLAQPLWQKVLDIISICLFVVGGMYIKFAIYFNAIVLGIVMLVIAIGLFWITHLKDKRT